MKLPAFFRTQKFYSLFASVFNSAIALVTFGLLLRAISKEDFGHWAFFLAIYGFIEMALNGLVRTPVIRMAANDQQFKYEEVLSSAWDILIKVAGSISVLLGIGFAIAYYVEDNEVYLKYIYWFPLYLIFTLPHLIGIWNSNALIKFERILLIRLISALVFLTSVLYVFLKGGTLDTIYWSYLSATIASSLLVISQGWAGFRYFLNSAKTYRRNIISFGRFSMGTTLGSSALSNTDSFIIMYFLGPINLAMYEVPRRILNLYDIPLRSILQYAYPYFSKKIGKVSSQEFQKDFDRISGFSFLVFIPLVVLIFIFADELVKLLGGEDYAKSAIVLRVFTVFLLLKPLDRFSGVILDVLNRPNINFIKVIAMLVVNVIGDVIVIKMGFGITGVAGVTTAMVITGIIYGFYMHRKEVKFRPLRLVRAGIGQARFFVRNLFNA